MFSSVPAPVPARREEEEGGEPRADDGVAPLVHRAERAPPSSAPSPPPTAPMAEAEAEARVRHPMLPPHRLLAYPHALIDALDDGRDEPERLALVRATLNAMGARDGDNPQLLAEEPLTAEEYAARRGGGGGGRELPLLVAFGGGATTPQQTITALRNLLHAQDARRRPTTRLVAPRTRLLSA